ncbi:hypothetical protein OnM2_058033 [Erysiphe neolycopersici]|uniref:CCHC-type domain-containing protein n=1 Tax=Erysiphe neolycopersici TaxID=212602 RepID=A0A420HQM6_9PEZI|nr:hypothetical protein OnM2_058033 [Erysiphe neolycopersici]
MAQISSRPLALIDNSFPNPKIPYVKIASGSVFDDPIASVNAATAQTVCYNCGKLGLYSTDCRERRKFKTNEIQSSKQEIFGTLKHNLVNKDSINHFYLSLQIAPPPPPRKSRTSASDYANQAIKSNNDDVVEQWDSDDCQDIEPISEISDNNEDSE